MKKEIMNFKNGDLGEITGYSKNEDVFLNLGNVCFNLGYTSNNSVGKTYLYKKRIIKICESLDITGVDSVSTNIKITKDTDFYNTYISEDNFYDLCLESHAKNARAFRKWVTSDVLPSIRKHGGYIGENATEEQVDKLVKYSLPKLKETFKKENIEKIHDTYYDIKEFYKGKSSDFRLKMMRNIERGLDERIDIYKDKKQVALITICDDLIKIIKEDHEKLKQRVSGGIRSHKTRLINKLQPKDEEYMVLDCHGMSENYMYETVKDDFTGDNITTKTNAYNNWIKYFPTYQLKRKEDLNIDWTKKINVFLKFDCVDKVDTQNLTKSIIDQVISRVYHEDDRIVEKIVAERNKTVNSYKEGKIYICIKNI